MSASEAHYFKFSTNWSSGQRLCGDCNLSYDAGQHIEITTLKPFTNYVCPTGGGYGHSSTYTGALIPSLRTLHQHLCICGNEFVVEDNESWTLTWEMKDPWSDEWRTVSNTQSKHAAHAQRDGLLELIERGEDVRNVVLEDDAAIANSGQFALEISAEGYPRNIGPFQSREDAEAWMEGRKLTGSWNVFPLVSPKP